MQEWTDRQMLQRMSSCVHRRRSYCQGQRRPDPGSLDWVPHSNRYTQREQARPQSGQFCDYECAAMRAAQATNIATVNARNARCARGRRVKNSMISSIEMFATKLE